MALTLACNKTMTILVGMALTTSVGLVLLFLGCAVDFHYGMNAKGVNWWGIFVFVFYIIAPVPLALARRCASQDVMAPENLNILTDICYFLSAFIVVSAFGLAVVLMRKHVIQAVAAGLIGGANVFVFATIYSFFVFFREDDGWEMSTF